jgi:hypothetical protein
MTSFDAVTNANCKRCGNNEYSRHMENHLKPKFATHSTLLAYYLRHRILTLEYFECLTYVDTI